MAVGSFKLLACLLSLAFWHAGVVCGRDQPQPRSLEARGTPKCGASSKGQRRCPDGLCCSKSGFCGRDIRYCGSGCQSEFSTGCDAVIPPAGEETECIARPHVGRVPYGENIKQCNKAGVVALTFDDGPWPNATERLLDLLAEKQVPATFFVAGSNKNKGQIDDPKTGFPATLRRMFNAGHQVGAHTWSHLDLNEISDALRRNETMFLEMAFRNLFGWFPTYMRAPRLRCSPSTGCLAFMGRWGYHVIHTNLNSKDWAIQGPSELNTTETTIRNALDKDAATNSWIVEFHDTMGDVTHQMVAMTIELAKQRGYQFSTVGDCLEDPRENWYRVAVGAAGTASTGQDETGPAAVEKTGSPAASDTGIPAAADTGSPATSDTGIPAAADTGSPALDSTQTLVAADVASTKWSVTLTAGESGCQCACQAAAPR